MARVLVTGMSGTGKTTLLNELRRRGHLTVDTDCDGWALPDGSWDEPQMLSAPLDVLIERVTKRTNNPYGNDPEQHAEIAGYVRRLSPYCGGKQRSNSTLDSMTRQPTDTHDHQAESSLNHWRPRPAVCFCVRQDSAVGASGLPEPDGRMS